jgi:hypothetical protein
MGPENVTLPRSEALSSETETRWEYSYYNDDLQPIHVTKVIYKREPKIIIYPFTYSDTRGLGKPRISTIELRGWKSLDDLPKVIKPNANVSVSHKKLAPLTSFLKRKFPNFNKLVIDIKPNKTRFTDQVITFSLGDLEQISKAIAKEQATFNDRKKVAYRNSLADVSSRFSKTKMSLKKGGLAHFLSHYEGDYTLSGADADAVLGMVDRMPLGNVAVTENFIETKNKVNVAYLEDVIAKFEALMDVKGDNEKEWQTFFEEHGWILASVFPYQVILRDREAYLGGKTIENKEGRVVDFLYQNGFRDNYALLEIKTHNKKLMMDTPYRGEDAFSAHGDCSSAISQCLDQKDTFQRDMGQKYKSLDAKSVLIIGRKDVLSDNQRTSFELFRNNQKNVDIVTFDELLHKIYGLKQILGN